MNQLSPASHIFFSERLRLHYVDWGGAAEKRMLLLHGMHDHCRTWDDLVDHYHDRYRVIAPDLRGHGDSAWVMGSAYHFLDYVYDTNQLVEQAELAPITLVGHSMGGAIAALYAGVCPEAIERLVVIEGIGMWRHIAPQPPVHERVREWITGTRGLAARQPRRYKDLHEAYQRMQHANPNLSDDQALHLTIHGSNQNEDGTYSWKYDNYTHNFSPAGFSEEETIALWQRIDCPVLVINADGGLEHRIGHDDTLKYFRNVTYHVIQDAGHWTYHDKLSEVLALMDDFLG